MSGKSRKMCSHSHKKRGIICTSKRCRCRCRSCKKTRTILKTRKMRGG